MTLLIHIVKKYHQERKGNSRRDAYAKEYIFCKLISNGEYVRVSRRKARIVSIEGAKP